MADVSRAVQVSGHGWLMARTWMRKCPRTNCGRACGQSFGPFKDTDSAWIWTGRGMTVDMAARGDRTWLRTGRGLTVAADTRAALARDSLRFFRDCFADEESLAY